MKNDFDLLQTQREMFNIWRLYSVLEVTVTARRLGEQEYHIHHGLIITSPVLRNLGVRIRKIGGGGRRLSGVPVATFRGATGSRPPGRGGSQPGGTPPPPTTTKLAFWEGDLGYSRGASLTYFLFKPRPKLKTVNELICSMFHFNSLGNMAKINLIRLSLRLCLAV